MTHRIRSPTPLPVPCSLRIAPLEIARSAHTGNSKFISQPIWLEHDLSGFYLISLLRMLRPSDIREEHTIECGIIFICPYITPTCLWPLYAAFIVRLTVATCINRWAAYQQCMG